MVGFSPYRVLAGRPHYDERPPARANPREEARAALLREARHATYADAEIEMGICAYDATSEEPSEEDAPWTKRQLVAAVAILLTAGVAAGAVFIAAMSYGH